jgi:outer membrane receptor protein involved in Fe transport
MFGKLVALSLSACAAAPAYAQDAEPELGASGDLDSLDLDSLLSLEVAVASLKATSLRESPGIVSVVTRQEILATGARDLIDVLRLLPGFFFGVDVQGGVGVGIRGNWGHEGKILLLIDGQEMNEIGYQTLQFGHHYPVDNIERIEIIRGPGSAIYGGNAELSVIRVVTRGGAEINGARGSVQYAFPHDFYSGDGDTTGFADVHFEAGNQVEELEWSISGHIGRSVRSSEDFLTLTGTTGSYNLGKNSEIRPIFVNGTIAYRGVHLRLIYDGYELDGRDAFDVPSELIEPLGFRSFYAELGGDFELTPGLKIMPKISYKRQLSWFTFYETPEEFAELIDVGTYAQRAYDRYLANVTASWDAFDEANVIVGAELFYDHATGLGEEPETLDLNWFFNDGELVQTLNFFTAAGFAQFLWPNEYVNFTVGGRIEAHSEFGVEAVPRIALTRVFDNGLHAKLLAAQAFRTPSFLNKSLEGAVDPDNKVTLERTSVLEAELGYRITDEVSVVGNGFITQIKDPIIYTYVVDADAEAYFNRGQTATFGGELEGRLRDDALDVMVSYAYYRRLGETVEEYAVPGSSSLLGAARHKLSGRVIIEVMPELVIAPSFSLSFGRYAYSAESPEVPGPLDPELLVGLAATGRNLFVPGLDVTVFAHDLFDTIEQFPQPYTGGHAPLPGPGRQIGLRLSYDYTL